MHFSYQLLIALYMRTFTFSTDKHMNSPVYKMIELVGSSQIGLDDAVRNAVDRASKTVRNLRWFEITQMRGQLEEDRIAHWQVALKIGFTLDEGSPGTPSLVEQLQEELPETPQTAPPSAETSHGPTRPDPRPER